MQLEEKWFWVCHFTYEWEHYVFTTINLSINFIFNAWIKSCLTFLFLCLKPHNIHKFILHEVVTSLFFTAISKTKRGRWVTGMRTGPSEQGAEGHLSPPSPQILAKVSANPVQFWSDGNTELINSARHIISSIFLFS